MAAPGKRSTASFNLNHLEDRRQGQTEIRAITPFWEGPLRSVCMGWWTGRDVALSRSLSWRTCGCAFPRLTSLCTHQGRAYAPSVARSNSGRVQGRLYWLRRLSGSSMILEVGMTKLKKLRDEAYNRQGGHCWYCGRPMLAAVDKRPTRCTAEHLLARCEGGRDVTQNVVAACWLCNSRRHRRKRPLTPEAYLKYVRGRLARVPA